VRSLPLALAVAVGCLAALPLRADIYRWVDGEGRVHFAGDLSRVPPEHRAEAERGGAATEGPSRLQTYDSGSSAAAAPAPVGVHVYGRVHRIPVQQASNGMVVAVRINGRTVAPFLIDTGASYVLLPRSVAEEAGVRAGPHARTMRFTTANGVVEQPIVMLDTVDLGTAHADDVPASISDSIPVGLLGLSFFNRFTYQVDAAAGVVTLIDNDLAPTGQILGGRSEPQWRGEFASLRARIAEVDSVRAHTPPAHGRRLAELDRMHADLQRQLDQLDLEADRAHVPDAWRHEAARE
jgi:clan AA aspartic protease (TIGR02281 family)